MTKLIKLISLLVLILNLASLTGQDASTPADGNLFMERESFFLPSKLQIYENDEVLQDRNIETRDNRIFTPVSGRKYLSHKNMTLNTDAAWLDDETYVVLTGNSRRYAHAILGDDIEAVGFEIYDRAGLRAAYELPDDRVFETLRPLVADLVPENPGKEIILTSSNRTEGARVEVYSLNGRLLGTSASIGRGYRWLHILGAAPFAGDERNYLALVKTPHINGILELLYWNGDSLEIEASFPGVSTHQIGSSNLNMALLMNADSSGDVEIILPTFDFRSLLILKYGEEGISEIKRFALPGRIGTNLYFEDGPSPSLWVGLAGGAFARIY